jgi:hypothetical protein
MTLMLCFGRQLSVKASSAAPAETSALRLQLSAVFEGPRI